MPTPRQPNIVDRLFDHLLAKDPKGREKRILEAARPPGWVKAIFMSLFFAGLAGLLLCVVHRNGWLSLPWEPTRWPSWFVFFLLFTGLQFIYREVHRQYGKRALLEDQSPE